MNKKLLLMGHWDGRGGSQTAFRMLIDFANQEGYDLKVIAISDHLDGKILADNTPVISAIPHKTGTVLLKINKLLGLFAAGIRTKAWAPEIFVSVGLNNSALTIARFMGSKTFKIGQEFIADRPIDDPLWLKSLSLFDGIAVQAPAMLACHRQVQPDIDGVNWLPCFPEPPIADVIQKNSAGKDGVVRISYFGRLAGNKGLDLLLTALAHPEIPADLSIDIWGKGEEEQRLKDLNSSLALTGRVRFMGPYPEGRTGAEQMASYDCLVLCSTRTEGLPLILLEAMAYGLPIMATNVGAIRDCCVDNPDAILIEPNEKSIVAGLQQVYQRVVNHRFDPDRQRQFYQKEFSYPVMASRWRKCLEEPRKFFYGHR